MNIFRAPLKFDESKLSLKKDRIYNGIIIHCTDGRSSDKPEDVHRWHLERGWAGCGYHYFISGSGLIFSCRPLKYIGSHCTGWNEYNVGICLAGKEFKEKETEQLTSLYELIKTLRKVLKIQHEKNVFPHNHFNKGKTCPNFKIDHLLY